MIKILSLPSSPVLLFPLEESRGVVVVVVIVQSGVGHLAEGVRASTQPSRPTLRELEVGVVQVDGRRHDGSQGDGEGDDGATVGGDG